MSDSSALRILIVDEEPLQRSFAQQVLAGAGWHAITAGDLPEVRLAWRESFDLVLLDLHHSSIDPLWGLAELRARHAGVAIPVIAFHALPLQDPARLLEQGFDDALLKPCTPEELVACAARWWPQPAGPATLRLRQVFGQADIDALLGRFRLLLAEALAALATEETQALAHRVAGIAGTLGFATLGQLWLEHSEGRGDTIALRRATRLAVGEIDRLQRRSA